MLFHNNPLLCIYFGNAEDELDPDQYLHYPEGIRLLSISPYKKLKKLMQLEQLVFPKQIHSATGIIIKETLSTPFGLDGDYLATQKKHVGIGVMTADCLPIVFYDALNQAIAIAHAGWRGSMQSIAPNTVEAMQKEFGTQLNQLRIYFGPSIKSCCYQVDEHFVQELEGFSFGQEVLHKEQNGLMFDLPKCNALQLRDMGIPKEAFNLQYNVCTSCDKQYCSYRRDGNQTTRQMTVATLK